MSNTKRYQKLASKWTKGTINEEEKIEFLEWYNSHQDEQLDIPSSFARDEEELKERILFKIRQSIHPPAKRLYLVKTRLAIAASLAVFLLGGLGYYLYVASGNPQNSTIELAEVQPGGNRATLTFTDGSSIDLNEQKSGLIIGDDIRYNDGSMLSGEGGNKAISYVTLATPKGGQYQLELPDGTKVWLNASSSLKFPNQFGKAYREVELLEGEAFFEVKSHIINNAKVPFFVRHENQLVEVLGTKFDINTYRDRPGITTTVTEGSVAVQQLRPAARTTKSKVVLSMGEQSMLKEQGISVKQVDPEVFTAWKDEYFYFIDADIYTVMAEFARWYDIEVKYEISRSNDLFVGKIPRNVTLGTALNVLKRAGVNFEWKEGRLLVVKQK